MISPWSFANILNRTGDIFLGQPETMEDMSSLPDGKMLFVGYLRSAMDPTSEEHPRLVSSMDPMIPWTGTLEQSGKALARAQDSHHLACRFKCGDSDIFELIPKLQMLNWGGKKTASTMKYP